MGADRSGSCLIITVPKGGEEADRWPWVRRITPRFVPDELLELKAHELGRNTGGLQNGRIRLKFDQFTIGVSSLARIVTD